MEASVWPKPGPVDRPSLPGVCVGGRHGAGVARSKPVGSAASAAQRPGAGVLPPVGHTASCDRKCCSLCPGHQSCWEVSMIAFLR